MASRKKDAPEQGGPALTPQPHGGAIWGENLEDERIRLATSVLAVAGITAPPALPDTEDEVPPSQPGAIILARPDSLSARDRATRMRIVREVCRYLEAETTPNNAANLAGYTIDEVEALMIVDPLARRMLLRAAAKAEFNLVQRARSGAKGVAKMALEFLARTHAGWATRTQQNLAVQFAEAVRELKVRLVPLDSLTGAQALNIVLDVLEKHSK
jgi:hypothetical protein